MTDIPETRWARSGDGSVAYQALGRGDRTLAVVVGAVSHVELVWKIEEQAAFLRGMAELGRTVHYDERGMGASDPIPSGRPPTLEQRVDDLMAVLDAAEVEQVDLLGFVDGAAVALMASLTYPDRVTSLALLEGYARLARSDDYLIGIPQHDMDAYGDLIERFHFDDEVGRANVMLNVPSIVDDPELIEAHIAYLRSASSPAQFVERLKFSVETDVRDILPLVDKPTLVIHGRHNRLIPVRFGRHLADHIPHCKYVELPNADVPPFFGSRESVLAELSHFYDQAPRSESVRSGRQLATVLFGEIESHGGDVAGIAVHVASRIMSLAEPGEIRVSSTVRDLAVGSGIEFDDRGVHALRGVPDEWHLLSVGGEAA